jgi:hypothetical protein
MVELSFYPKAFDRPVRIAESDGGDYLSRNRKNDGPVMCRLVVVGLTENRSRSSRVSITKEMDGKVVQPFTTVI